MKTTLECPDFFLYILFFSVWQRGVWIINFIVIIIKITLVAATGVCPENIFLYSSVWQRGV